MAAAGTRVRRRVTLSLALAALMVAIPLGVYLWGRNSESFVVERVAVSGQRRVSQRELERVLRDRYLGTNLFSITADDVRETVSRFPYIADVAVDRDYPETLRVRITEYLPTALLLADGAWYVLSEEGRVVARLESPTGAPDTSPGATPAASQSPRPSKSPQGANGTPADLTSGQMLFSVLPAPPRSIVPAGLRHLPVMATDMPVTVGADVGDPHVVEGLEILAALPAGMRRDILAVRVTDSNARAHLSPGLEVEFGSADDLRVKVLALQAVLRRYRERHVRATFVDVSVPQRPLGAPLLPTPAAP
jgi:cell division septal protein FtsQ